MQCGIGKTTKPPTTTTEPPITTPTEPPITTPPRPGRGECLKLAFLAKSKNKLVHFIM